MDSSRCLPYGWSQKSRDRWDDRGELGVVGVARHHDIVPHGDVEVGQHVALGERGEQELLGIPAVALAVERRVRGAGQIRKTVRPDDVRPVVVAIARRPDTARRLIGD